MSFWIKLDTRLPRHRKTYALAKLLAQGDGELLPNGRTATDWRGRALGLLTAFWGYVAEHHPSGDVTDADREAIRDAVHEWLEPSAWTCEDVRTLLAKSGHLERTRRNRIVVHGWLEWTGSDLMRLAKDRQRKQLARSSRSKPRRADVPGAVRGRGADETRSLAKPRLAKPRLSKTRKTAATPALRIEALSSDAHAALEILEGNLPAAHYDAAVGVVRASQNPDGVLLGLRSFGPGGIDERIGVGWAVVGRAIFDFWQTGERWNPAFFRGFVRRALEAPVPGSRPQTDAEKMHARAEQLEREGVP